MNLSALNDVTEKWMKDYSKNCKHCSLNVISSKDYKMQYELEYENINLAF